MISNIKTMINYRKRRLTLSRFSLVEYRSGESKVGYLTNVASKYGHLQISFSLYHSISKD